MKIRRRPSLSYGDLFESWEIAVAKRVIKRSTQKWKCLDDDEFDDLLQECLTHWYFKRETYNSDKVANRKTYMAKIIHNRIKDIIAERNTDKRRIDHESISLDEPYYEDNEESTLHDRVSDRPISKEDTDRDYGNGRIS